MNYRDFNETMRTNVANLINQAAGADTVQPDDIVVLWTDGMLELHRGLCWYGERLYMVSYNSLTDTWTIDTYTKNV